MSAEQAGAWLVRRIGPNDRAKAGMKKQHYASGGEPARRESTDALGANSEIGRKLRQYYDGLVSEEVPDRFMQLLGQLESTETAKSAAPAGDKDGERA